MTATTLRAMTDLIERHCAHMRSRGLSPNTIYGRRELLSRVDRDLPMGIELATVEELSDWLAREGWSRKTRAIYYTHIKSFFDWACDANNPHLDWNPAASLTRPKFPPGVPKPVTDDELRDAIRYGGELRVAILLAAYAGLRCCELATITRSDVNERTITVVGKGDKTRVIPTALPIWETVAGMRGRLVDGTARQISDRGCEHFAKVQPGVTLHRFRHWFATTMLANGVDLLTVSKLLGHSSTQTTAVYCQITDGQRRTAIQALPALHAPAST